ncbi:hypothetical protein QSJ19_20135 [Gordonia sp. ABSL11-1]|nr:hypothetical protein [Gordonia sp. ABSL11-1]MDL9947846.1 hypothetical protein [Gordonia sp. ABSL11-1]
MDENDCAHGLDHVIGCGGHDRDMLRPDGTPEGDADDVVTTIQAITEHWT